MSDAGLLGPDVLVVHATNMEPGGFELMGQSNGQPHPYTEMRTGFGIPPVRNFMKANVPISFSVDTTLLCGNADMFAIMKVILEGRRHTGLRSDGGLGADLPLGRAACGRLLLGRLPAPVLHFALVEAHGGILTGWMS
jgi:cytosine/adenosine deaminase-related metal-dependent hydrolase